MRVRCRPHRGVTHSREVKRHQTPVAYLVVIERGEFHDEVMRMLPINDRLSECSLALLKQQWILTTTHGRRLQARHEAKRQCARTELALRHGHKPICREDLVSATRPALLLHGDECVRMK